MIAAGLLVGVLAGWFLLMSNAWSERASEAERLADVTQRADRMQLSADEQDNLRAALPAQVNRREVQAAVESAARAANLYPTALSITPVNRGAVGATVRVDLLGTPEGLKSFITRLTGSLEMRPGADYAYATSRAPVMTVEGVDVRALPGADRIRASITLKVLRFAPARR